MKTKIKFSKRILSLLMAVMMLVTSAPLVSYAGEAEDSGVRTTSSYANYKGEDGNTSYKAEYADPTNSNAITKLQDPYYRMNFGTDEISSISDISSDSASADISSVAERDHCLKLGARSAAPGGYMTFDNNPFAGLSTTDLKSSGLTLMGWEYYTYDKSNVAWVPLITFYGVPSSSFFSKYGLNSQLTDDNNNDNYWYITFTLGGYVSISAGAVDGNNSYNNYHDYYTNGGDTDITNIPYTDTEKTVTMKTTNTWTHYAFSVTTEEISFYFNGVKYEFTSESTGNVDNVQVPDSRGFEYLFDFITNENVKCSLGYGLGYWYNGSDQYIDDFRVYDSALTQQQIRSIYGENDDTSYYKYAEGHDPTIVYNETKQNGEFSYYMFGTGMTVYGSNDLANWYELADEEGRTGYQSTKLFGEDYRTALGADQSESDAKSVGTAPLCWSGQKYDFSQTRTEAKNNKGVVGEGYLVWAPSVIYNTKTQKWQMYAAASSWGSVISCIFVAESDSIEGPYTNITPLLYSGFHDNGREYTNLPEYWTGNKDDCPYLEDADDWSWLTGTRQYKSGTWPNCIDPAPFYDEDGELYMSYGSWSGGIFMVKLADSGLALDNTSAGDDFDVYFGKKIAATTSETTGSRSGEGSFVYYDSDTGYYYLTVSYGAVHSGAYTMRMWRSTDVAGPYEDVTGISSLTSNTDEARSGYKLMGNYSFIGAGTRYNDNGHSSSLIVPSDSGTNEAGKQFLSYHTRFYDGYRTERAYCSTNILNSARVHQVVMSKSGWPCVLPYQYSGETFGDDGFVYSAANLSGTWSFLLFNAAVTDTLETYVSVKFNQNGTITGSYNGIWTLTKNGDKPYLDMTLDIDGTSYTFEGVFITMTGELGSTRTVFSAVGMTEGYKTMAWGALAETMAPASSASDSGLTCVASDGYDNIIYTHGTNSANESAARSASDYIFYGTEISDGTVASSENAGVQYHGVDENGNDITGIGVAGNNTGYEQGERATYIYINEQYSVSDALTTSSEDSVTATQIDSDREGYKKYLLSGTIQNDFSDPDDFLNITVSVPYTGPNGSEYTEYIYATVMPNPVSANAAAAAYNSNSKTRESTAFLRADGSTGSTSVSNGFTGAYAYIDNPVYLSGLCGWNFVINAGKENIYMWLSPTVFNTVVSAGSYIVDTNSSSSKNLTISNTDNATVTAGYYLDLSKLDESGTQTLGGLTVDAANKTLSFSMLGVELTGSSEKPTKRTQTFTLSDNDNSFFTWDNHTSTYVYNNSPTVVNTENVPTGTSMMYDASVISADYTNYATASKTAAQTFTATATFTEDHESDNPQTHANAVIGLSVKIFDKSAVYDVLQAFGDMGLVMSDYTDETRAEYEEAIAQATWYCNNYKLFDKTVNNEAVNPEDYMAGLVSDIKTAYQTLFSYGEFEEYYELYEWALQVYEQIQNETLEGDSDDIKNALKDAIEAFENFAKSDETGEVFDKSTWNKVADYEEDGETYNPNYGGENNTYVYGASSSLRAKFAFNYAAYMLIKSMSEVRSLTDYSELETTLYGMTYDYSDIVDSTYGEGANNGYTDDYDDSKGGLENRSAASKSIYVHCTDEDGELLDLDNGQVYTLSTWYDFSAAYDTALARSKTKASADSIGQYRATEYKYDLSTGVEAGYTIYGYYADLDDPDSFDLEQSYDEDDVLKTQAAQVEIQSFDTLSEAQESIDAANSALVAARSALKQIGEEESFEAYNAAQQLAALADLDAYLSDAQTVLKNYAARGYVNKADNYVNVSEFSADDASIIYCPYVSYNGKYYKNTITSWNDSYTSTILNTLNATDGRTVYNVTFNVYADGALLETQNNNYYFGENVKLDASSYDTSNYVIARWEVQSGDNTASVIKNDTFAVEREIQQDTTVNLYLTSVVEDAKLVTVVDYYGKLLDRIYVTEEAFAEYTTGERVVISQDKNISVTDSKGTAHSISVNESADFDFYAWKAMTDDADDEGNAVSVEIYQVGVSKLGKGEISVSGGTLTDSDGNTYYGSAEQVKVACALQDLITISATDTDDFFAWVETVDGTNYYVASYDSTFTTFAYGSGITYIAATDDSISQYITDEELLADVTAYQVPFSFGTAAETLTVDNVKKFRLYCSFSQNDNYGNDGSSVEIVQYGVLAVKDGELPDDFTKGASGVTTVTANASSEYSTYTMTTTVGDSAIYMRSFVSYIYTDSEGNSFPRVAYGAIYACDSNGTITSSETASKS